jgi:transposase-like protein
MFSEMKTHERAEARRLRREEGRSVKEIERLLGVARSTASRWVRDIPLTSAQRSALKQRNPIYNGQFAGAATNAERGRARRLAYQERGRQKKRKNKLPYGTCRISVHSTEIVQTIYGSIQEFVGFDRADWLDGA